MANPLGGAGGGGAMKALQQLQEMQQRMQQQTQVNPAGGDSAFANKMQTPQVDQAQKVQEGQRITQDIRPQNIRPNQMQDTAQTQRVGQTQKTQSGRFDRTSANQPTKFDGIAKFFRGMDSRKSSLDTMIKQAMNGKAFNNKELLALQYKVSQFSLEMDLTSKVVDKTTGGIKQAMNTQV